jgi:hypothetical protein
MSWLLQQFRRCSAEIDSLYFQSTRAVFACGGKPQARQHDLEDVFRFNRVEEKP